MSTARIVVALALCTAFVTTTGYSREANAQDRPQTPGYAAVLQRAEPVTAIQPAGTDQDRVVVMQVTIPPSGDPKYGPVEIVGREGTSGRLVSGSTDPESLLQTLQRSTRESEGAAAADLRAALDAFRLWRFGAVTQPFTTVVGFNLARTEQSGGRPSRLPSVGSFRRREKCVTSHLSTRRMQRRGGSKAW